MKKKDSTAKRKRNSGHSFGTVESSENSSGTTGRIRTGIWTGIRQGGGSCFGIAGCAEDRMGIRTEENIGGLCFGTAGRAEDNREAGQIWTAGRKERSGFGTAGNAEDSLRLETVRKRVRQRLSIYRRNTDQTVGHSEQTLATGHL